MHSNRKVGGLIPGRYMLVILKKMADCLQICLIVELQKQRSNILRCMCIVCVNMYNVLIIEHMSSLTGRSAIQNQLDIWINLTHGLLMIYTC